MFRPSIRPLSGHKSFIEETINICYSYFIYCMFFLDKKLATWWWPNWRKVETCSQLQTTLAINNVCTSCVWLIYLLIVFISNSGDGPPKEYLESILTDGLFIRSLYWILTTSWTVRGSNTGGGEIFHARPYQSRGPSSLLWAPGFYGGYNGQGVVLTTHPI
jgi:hypothetical protein